MSSQILRAKSHINKARRLFLLFGILLNYTQVSATTVSAALTEVQTGLGAFLTSAENFEGACNCPNAVTGQFKGVDPKISALQTESQSAEAATLGATAQVAAPDVAGNSAATSSAGSAVNSGMGYVGASAAKCSELMGDLKSREQAAYKNAETCLMNAQKNTQIAQKCMPQKQGITDAFSNLQKSQSSAQTACPSSLAGAAGGQGSASSMGKNAKSIGMGALIGAGLAAAAMGMMGGEDEEETPKDIAKTPEVPKVETPKNPDGTCPTGMISISAGVCTVPGSGASAATTPIKPEDQTVVGNQGKIGAGNEDPLGIGRGIAADSTGTSSASSGASSTGRGIGANNATGSIGGGSGGGGAGSGAAGGANGVGALANGGAGGANSLASNLGYNSFAGSGEKAEGGESIASVTVDTFVDGIDEKGPYVFKFINGKKVKVRVKCKTNRCEVRNEIRNKIAADPLLQ